MLDPITASSLASSIITFVDFTYKVGKRAYELSQITGELPPDIQKCREVAEILARATERLNAELPQPGTAAAGPIAPIEADLRLLFDQCTEITKSFLDLLDELSRAKSLSKVLKVVRKEGRLQRIHDALDKHLVEILYLLNSQSSIQTTQIRTIIATLREEMLRHHAKLEAKMSTSIQQFTDAMGRSNEEVLCAIDKLSRNQEDAADNRQMELISGQQDLSQNLERASRNILDSLDMKEDALASKMEATLRAQGAAASALSHSSMTQEGSATAVQLARLDDIMSRALKDIKALRSEADPKKEYQVPQGSNNERGLIIRGEFEFSVKTDIIAIHIKHCAQLISTRFSTNLRLSSSLPPLPCSFRLWGSGKQNSQKPTGETISVILQTVTNKQLLAHVQCKGEGGDLVSDAIAQACIEWRGPFQSIFSFMTISRISYVKYAMKDGRFHCLLATLGQDHKPGDNSSIQSRTAVELLLGSASPKSHSRIQSSDFVSDDSKTVHGYALSLEEELSAVKPLTVFAMIGITRILLAYFLSAALSTCVLISYCICLALQISAFLLLNTTDQPIWSIFKCTTNVSIYYSLRYFLQPPTTLGDVGIFFAYCDLSMVGSLFTMSSLFSESRSPVTAIRALKHLLLVMIIHHVLVYYTWLIWWSIGIILFIALCRFHPLVLFVAALFYVVF